MAVGPRASIGGGSKGQTMNEGELGYGVKGGGVKSLVSGLAVTAAR